MVVAVCFGFVLFVGLVFVLLLFGGCVACFFAVVLVIMVFLGLF